VATRDLAIQAGEVLFLYTDGVTEAENAKGEAFSEHRFRSSISNLPASDLAQLIERVRRDIAHHAEGQPQSDDITLLALKYNGQTADQSGP